MSTFLRLVRFKSLLARPRPFGPLPMQDFAPKSARPRPAQRWTVVPSGSVRRVLHRTAGSRSRIRRTHQPFPPEKPPIVARPAGLLRLRTAVRTARPHLRSPQRDPSIPQPSLFYSEGRAASVPSLGRAARGPRGPFGRSRRLRNNRPRSAKCSTGPVDKA